MNDRESQCDMMDALEKKLRSTLNKVSSVKGAALTIALSHALSAYCLEDIANTLRCYVFGSRKLDS